MNKTKKTEKIHNQIINFTIPPQFELPQSNSI
jgi:hypothetical protein